MTMLDTELIRSFVAICDTGSFTAAGSIVGRTQSAISMQVKRLEETLGCQLFRRNPHRLSLTVKGELFLTHAQRILRAHQDAMTAFDRNAVTGVVTLGIPQDYAYRLLPRILAEFAELYPAATVDVLFDQSKDLIPRVQEGKLDLAFVTGGEGAGTGEVVHREPCVWVTGAHSTAHEHTPLPLVVAQEGCTYRRWAVEALIKRKREFRIGVISASVTGMQAAVRAGLAVSVLAQSSVIDGMRVLTRKEGFPPLPMLEVQLQRARSKDSPLLDRLQAFLVDRLSKRLPIERAA